MAAPFDANAVTIYGKFSQFELLTSGSSQPEASASVLRMFASGNGKLYYMPDGVSGSAAKEIATSAGGLDFNLTAGDAITSFTYNGSAAATVAVNITGESALATVADADTMLIDDGDGGTVKKITRANLLGSAVAAFSNGLTSTTVSGSGAGSFGSLTLDGVANLQSAGISNAGSIAGVTGLTATANLDIGAYDFRAATLTADGLTATRVVFAGANGVLSNDSDMTFSGDTLTVTKLGAWEAAGSIDFSDEAMTNVNVDSGAIDGTVIGANSAAAGTFAAVVAASLNNSSGGITNAGAISGASTLAMGGALTGATSISGSGTISGFDLDMEGAGNFLGNLTVQGNLVVEGTRTVIDTTDLLIEDNLIEMNRGDGSAGTAQTNAAAGIFISGSTADRAITITGASDGGRLKVSGSSAVGAGFDVVTGGDYAIAGTSVLTATTLGGAVVASSLTSVGTLTSGQLGTDGSPLTAYINAGEIDGTVIGSEAVAAGSFAAVVGTTGTYSGVLKTDDATEATSTTDGSLQTDGGLSVAKSAVIGDDLDLLSDGAVINIGSTSKFTLTDQSANNCVMAASGARLAFGNAGEYISGDGTDLDIISSGDLDVTATLVDMTAALTVSGVTTLNANVTLGNAASDVTTLTGQLTSSVGMMVNDDQKLNFGTDADASIAYDEANSNSLIISGSAIGIGAMGDYFPVYDDTYDLGTSGAQWRDLHLDGVAYIDDLRADALGAAMNCASQAMTNINVDSGAIDGTIIGANSAAAGTFAAVIGTTAVFSSTLNAQGATTLDGAVTLGNATADDLTFMGRVASDIQPKTDSAYDLGTSALQFATAYVDEVESATGVLTLTTAAGIAVAGTANASGYLLELPTNGDARARAWVTYSSARHKTNVQTLENPVETMKKLRGVSYDWKGTGQHDVGFIAEEVGSIVPEVVSFGPDGRAEGIDYGRLTSVLVEAMKQQQVEIEKLQVVVRNLTSEQPSLLEDK